MSGRLCDYKYSLGVPGEGVHRPRIFGLAAFDVAGLALAVVAVVRYFSMSLGAGALTLFIMVLFTIFIHWIFCVPTAGNVALGLS